MNRVEAHDSFVTTTRGLDRSTPPMKLFEKAKRYGIWNPSDIDFTQDKQDWQRLNDQEREVILHLTSLFVAGEEAVTLDLLPLMMTVAKEGRIEEEMFLTTFLWEEAKHTDFFQRFLNEVLQVNRESLTRFHGPAYRTIIYEALPRALDRLMVDQSPEAQIEASITYNMIVEGTLAETGYHAYFTMLRNNHLMPGNTEGIQKLKQDESRHIAYGIFLISRIISEQPHLWDFAQAKMQELLMPALGVIDDIFSSYDPMPFGLKQDDFVSYAMMQFQKRLSRIEAARSHSLNEIYQVTHAAIDAEDA
ncbi:R2-like ligand-binding oxidase [Aggregatilineales bacterium SYSU G02658]